MSRVSDGLRKAKQRGDMETGIVPEPREAIPSIAEISVPWRIDPPIIPIAVTPTVADRSDQSGHDPSGDTAELPGSMTLPPVAAHVGSHLVEGDDVSGTLAEVIRPAFPRSWQEGVAIVQAVASKVRRGGAVPAPEHIFLERNGVVTFASRNDSGEHPVISLAVLLGWLLEGTDPPPALQRVAVESACPRPAAESVSSFSRVLAAFEGPDSRTGLLAVAARMHHSAPIERSGVLEKTRHWLGRIPRT